MGLFSKVASIFSRPAPPSSPAPNHQRPWEAPPARDDPHDDHDAATAVIDDNRNADDTPVVEVMPVALRRADPAPAPHTRRSRQDMVDELERSYRQVVDLVQKVDAHLDRADDRAQRMADIAERMLQAAERIPEAINQDAAQRHAEHLDLLRAVAEESRSGAGRVESALVNLGVQHEVASQSHEQLVSSMADFRETMSEVGRTNARTATAIEQGNTLKRESDQRLAAVISGTQRWMIVILATAMLLAAASLAVAVAALMRG